MTDIAGAITLLEAAGYQVVPPPKEPVPAQGQTWSSATEIRRIEASMKGTVWWLGWTVGDVDQKKYERSSVGAFLVWARESGAKLV